MSSKNIRVTILYIYSLSGDLEKCVALKFKQSLLIFSLLVCLYSYLLGNVLDGSVLKINEPYIAEWELTGYWTEIR